MTRTKKQTHNGDERAALILELFRQLPDNKFSLRHLASASGGASKEGRRETMQIVEQLLATGVIESCPRDKYRLSPAQRPRLEGTVEMLNTGSMFVHVEGMEQQVYIHSRNSLNALDGDRVQLVLTRKARGSNAPEGEITRDRRTQPQTLRRHGRSQRTQCLRACRLAQDARRRLPPQARLPEREKRR